MGRGADFEHLERDTPATLAWEAEQDARTEKMLEQTAGRDALANLVRSLPAGRWASSPWHAGSRWFDAAERAAGSGIALSARVEHSGVEWLLFDPSTEPDRSLREFWPSPDGTKVVAAVLHGSSEAGELRLIDVESTMQLGAPDLYTTLTRVAWLPDGSGYYFNGVAFDGSRMRGAIYHRTVDGAAVEEPVSCGSDAYPVGSADGRRLLVTGGSHRLRPVAILDRAANTWTAFDLDDDDHVDAVPSGDRLVAITTRGADRGRVVEIPVATAADPSTWRELVPESDAVLRALSVIDERLILSELVEGCGRLRVIDLEDSSEEIVPLPIQGAISTSGSTAPLVGTAMFRPSSGHAELTFLASGPGNPPQSYAYSIDDRQLRELGDPSSARPKAIVSETIRSVSPDGTVVPCVLAYLRDLDRTRPQPTLVLAYGGFNLPNTPRYQPATMAFVLSGGIVAYPLLRGGGEFGDNWWHAGRRHAKQNTFDDLYAVCDQLIDAGVATPSTLALQGGSNGGITAAVALAQRPDLFAAVVASAPLSDLLRHHLGAVSQVTTAAMISEFGDPSDADDRRSLQAWSPYQNTRAADTSPAVLVAAPADDVRTPRWHARKLVAVLQDRRPEAPAFLRIWRNYGHGTGGGTTSERTVEWLSFIMDHLELEPAAALR